MSEDNKKVIRDFISYLNSDTIKYSFNNGSWSYDSRVYDFIGYCVIFQRKFYIKKN